MYSNSASYFTNFNKDLSPEYKVIKLGGTSQCKIGYDNLIEILQTDNNIIYVIVLSAQSGTTNLLCRFTETKDKQYIVSIGE